MKICQITLDENGLPEDVTSLPSTDPPTKTRTPKPVEIEKSARRKVTLRSGTDAGTAAELITLLETLIADGTITDDEMAGLRAWLDDNRESGLPGIEFLRSTLEQILGDGRVTEPQRRALYMAVWRVLPPELRSQAKAKRAADELEEKTRQREQRSRDREQKAERRAQEHAERVRNACARLAMFFGHQHRRVRGRAGPEPHRHVAVKTAGSPAK